MKKTFFVAMATIMASCTCTSELVVNVTNINNVDRDDETIEIAWSEINSIEGITAENVIVKYEGAQIPSQVIYNDTKELQSLIFQVNVGGNEGEEYIITTGIKEEYPMEAFGRFVPERMTDYAWENNKVVYRLYGPELESQLSTPGIDVWVKSTEKLVINDWYKRPNYHINEGDGMDCYMVGKTLGAGASTPIVGDTLWLSGNYVSQQTLSNGPIRTSVKLTYAPFDVDGKSVSVIKHISLDANRYFSRMDNIYSGDFQTLSVAAGFIRHDVKGVDMGKNFIAMYEGASDTKTPDVDGDIYFSIIMNNAEFYADKADHTLAIAPTTNGKTLTYYSGSGWSNAGIDNFEEWMEIVKDEIATVETPLQYTIAK